MRWPFVMRSTHEAAVAGRDALINVLRADNARIQGWAGDWRTRHDELAEKYHALRMQGGNAAEIRPTLAPRPEPSGPIAEAIEERCRHYIGVQRTTLRAQLSRYASRMKAEEMDEGDIAHAIMNWSDPDEEVA